MIAIDHVTKTFDGIAALQNVTAQIEKGSIYGLIGSNGSGKSTLLRILAGIYRPDQGLATLDDRKIYESNPEKSRIFYISDDPYVMPNATLDDMSRYYRRFYPSYNVDLFHSLVNQFQLERHRPLKRFSKGMQRQAHIIQGLAAQPEVLLCDETFDGLDPMRRQAVKRILAQAAADKAFHVIITSHNLREIEDICDQIGLLHQGELVLAASVEDVSRSLHKVQVAFADLKAQADFAPLDLALYRQSGRMVSMVVRGDQDAISHHIQAMAPLYWEMVPLSLEEVFITEMEVRGYDIDTLIF